jgi:hypothetical protein
MVCTYTTRRRRDAAARWRWRSRQLTCALRRRSFSSVCAAPTLLPDAVAAVSVHTARNCVAPRVIDIRAHPQPVVTRALPSPRLRRPCILFATSVFRVRAALDAAGGGFACVLLLMHMCMGTARGAALRCD